LSSVPEGAVALQLPSPQTAKLVGHGLFRGGGRVLCAGRGLSPGQHPALAKKKSIGCWVCTRVPTQLLTHHTQTTYHMPE
jgi:3'-phosphoadenosine 5'-phosphosulfate sulfotransferase (PAPS reductase)/FAD synthetase